MSTLSPSEARQMCVQEARRISARKEGREGGEGGREGGRKGVREGCFDKKAVTLVFKA